MSYQCPICHFPLVLNHFTWQCENHHSFDKAKEGYVNLMPVQHKNSKNPGDNPAMIQARRTFLQAGHYQILHDAVNNILRDYLPRQAEKILDIGCGEGYYTAEIANTMMAQQPATVYGLDISKFAIRYAAKRYPLVNFCVASSYRLPFADNVFDAVIRIYAPCKYEELNRVVKTGGFVLTVTPAPRHLFQLKELIYPVAQPHPLQEEHWFGFDLVFEQNLHERIQISGVQATNLLQMTPFAWKANEEIRSNLAKLQQFACEVDFTLKLYKKNH